MSGRSRHSVYRIAAAGSLSSEPKLPCPSICADAKNALKDESIH